MQITQMRIPAPPSALACRVAAPAPTADAPSLSGWRNPAASAALRSAADLLGGVEDGIVRNFDSYVRVRTMVGDLRSSLEVIGSALDALASDASTDNDQFLPLIGTAGSALAYVENRLTDGEIGVTWLDERADILASVRKARTITHNAAAQLDSSNTTSRR